jgi:hypothetical protein
LTWRSWEPLGIVSIFENSMLVDCHLSSNKGMRKVKQSTTSKETVAPSTSATDVSASTLYDLEHTTGTLFQYLSGAITIYHSLKLIATQLLKHQHGIRK